MSGSFTIGLAGEASVKDVSTEWRLSTVSFGCKCRTVVLSLPFVIANSSFGQLTFWKFHFL